MSEEKRNQKNYEPEPTSGDTAHAIARAGIASIPVVGGAATELFNAIITPPLERRRQEWMIQIGETLRELEERPAATRCTCTIR